MDELNHVDKLNNINITDYYNWFLISIESLNLFSFVLGAMYGLSTSAFNRYKQWWNVAGYFVLVALYFAFKSGSI